MPRARPLAVCPSVRCRRAKLCLAALDGLYCLRSHHSLAELKARRRCTPLQRDLDRVAPVLDAGDLDARLARVVELAAIRRGHEDAMRDKWRAGILDHLYGKYRRDGVVLRPPPRTYGEK
jgi:hypothetical protein